MHFTQTIRWLVKARDFSYRRRPEKLRHLTLARYPWREVATTMKHAIQANDPDIVSTLKIPISDIDRNQMSLMYLSVQALVPYCSPSDQAEPPNDSRLFDIFNEVARVYENAGKKSPLQRRILGVNFFVKDYKIRTERKRVMVSYFSTTESVSTFERALYLSLVLQACKKTQFKCNNYNFCRTNQDHCQRLGVMVCLIVRACNSFAKTCGYDSMEDMTAPFIIWNSSQFEYEPIAENGVFSPKHQRYCLSMSSLPTRDENLVDPMIFSLPLKQQEKLREVAKFFINELSSCVLDDNLLVNNFDPAHALGAPYFLKEENSICPRLMQLRWSIQDQFPVPSAILQEWNNCESPSRSDSSPAENEFSMQRPQPAHIPTPRHTAECRDLVMQEISSTTTLARSQGRTRVCREVIPTPLTEQEEVLKRMETFVDMYCCSFRDLLCKYDEKHGSSISKPNSSHSLLGQVQLLLTDPRYSVSASCSRTNSDCEQLTLSDMKLLISMAGDLLRPGGHGIIFCSFQHYGAWQVLISEEAKPDGDPLFNISPVPYNLLSVPGGNRSANSTRSTSLESTGEIAIHFVKRGIPHDLLIEMIDYNDRGDVPSRFPGFSNTIDNVPELGEGEQLKFNGRPLRKEQKSVFFIRELITKHSKPGDIVVDLFSGTFTTAVRCITVPKGLHRHFVGCELSELAFKMARRRLITTFAKLVLSGEISVDDASKPLSSTLEGILSTSLLSRRDECKATVGFPSSTRLPPDTITYLARIPGQKDIEMLTMQIPAEWPILIQERVLSIPINVLRAYECMRSNVYIAKSSINHPSSGLGLFAAQDLHQNSVIGHYYGPLVYEPLLTNANATRVYGNRMGVVTKNDFQKYAIELLIDNRKLGLPSYQGVFLVPSEYNVFRFLNDCRYMPGDKDYFTSGPRRTKNVQFCQPEVIDNIQKLRSPYTIKVKPLEKIQADTELLVDYGTEYMFPQTAQTRNIQNTVLAGKRKRLNQ